MPVMAEIIIGSTECFTVIVSLLLLSSLLSKKMSAAEARFLPGTDVNVPHNVTSSEFGSSIVLVSGYYLIQIFSVYYRVYHNSGAIATKRPAYIT